VAFKLAMALEQKELLMMDSRELLDLVGFGTVADLVPLKGENRILVKYGLERLRDTKRTGMISLMTESGIDISAGISAVDIAYKLGPRVNSAGRMGDPDMALDLMLTRDRVDADLFARELNTLNFKRKAIGTRLVGEIEKCIEESEMTSDPFIVAAGEGWNPGVLGISANRIMEKMARPVAVLSVDGDVAKGSVRAPEGFDLLEALESVSDLLTEYGGHERAAGITLDRNYLVDLRSRLTEFTSREYPDRSFIPSITVDIDVGIRELSIEELTGLEELGPFGTDNPGPIISIRDAMIGDNMRTVGEGRHLKFTLLDGPHEIQCIFFNGGEFEKVLQSGMIVSAVGEPGIHRWRGRENIQLRIDDLRSNELMG
jgi:single-stranded-DNA-specific exonuclease